MKHLTDLRRQVADVVHEEKVAEDRRQKDNEASALAEMELRIEERVLKVLDGFEEKVVAKLRQMHACNMTTGALCVQVSGWSPASEYLAVSVADKLTCYGYVTATKRERETVRYSDDTDEQEVYVHNIYVTLQLTA